MSEGPYKTQMSGTVRINNICLNNYELEMCFEIL